MVIVETLHYLDQLLNPNRTAVLEPNLTNGGILIAALLALVLTTAFGRKLAKMILTFRALALTPVISRILSNWVKAHSFSEEEFLRADGAGDLWVEQRRKALDGLADVLRTKGTKSIAWATELRESFLICVLLTLIGCLFRLCG
jgi:hypothetical protein